MNAYKTLLNPFEIVKVPNRITPIDYMYLIKRLQLPFAKDATMKDHDIKFHIKPLVRYKLNLDSRICEKLATIIQQPKDGILEYNVVDLHILEFFSFLISRDDLITEALTAEDGANFNIEQTPTFMKSAVSKCYTKELNLELMEKRWYYNLERIFNGTL